MYILHLLNKGYKRCEAADIVGCHANSVTNYVKLYNSFGLSAVRQLEYPRSRHELSAVYEEADEALSQAECTTLDDAREVLRSEFGYGRSKEAVRRLVHHLGFKRRKTGTFPSGKTVDTAKSDFPALRKITNLGLLNYSRLHATKIKLEHQVSIRLRRRMLPDVVLPEEALEVALVPLAVVVLHHGDG